MCLEVILVWLLAFGFGVLAGKAWLLFDRFLNDAGLASAGYACSPLVMDWSLLFYGFLV